MGAIELVLVMLAAVVISGVVVRVLPVAIPVPLVQIGLGALIAIYTGDAVQLNPELFFLLFLPPLLFLDGWRIPKEGMLHDHRMILALALGLVFITVLGMGWFIVTVRSGRIAPAERIRLLACARPRSDLQRHSTAAGPRWH